VLAWLGLQEENGTMQSGASDFGLRSRPLFPLITRHSPNTSSPLLAPRPRDALPMMATPHQGAAYHLDVECDEDERAVGGPLDLEVAEHHVGTKEVQRLVQNILLVCNAAHDTTPVTTHKGGPTPVATFPGSTEIRVSGLGAGLPSSSSRKPAVAASPDRDIHVLMLALTDHRVRRGVVLAGGPRS
jgi:hypothetical protein